MITFCNNKSIFIILVLLQTILSGCTKKTNSEIHPTDTFLNKIESYDLSKSFNTLKIHSLNDSISTKYDLGKSNELNNQNLFTSISNIAVSNDGIIFTSSSLTNEIIVFDEYGSYLSSIGKSGRGPGEFTRLTKIALHSEKNLLVALDNYEIEIFDISDVLEPKHLKTLNFEIQSSSDVCISENYIFVAGQKIYENPNPDNIYDSIFGSKPIHKIRLSDLSYIESFGKTYASSTGYAPFEGILSKTFIECTEQSDNVIAIFSTFPYVTVYDGNSGESMLEFGILDLTVQNYEEFLRGSEPILKKRKSNQKIFAYDDFINFDTDKYLLQIVEKVDDLSDYSQQVDYIRNNHYIIPIVINSRDGSITKYRKENHIWLHRNDTYQIVSKPFSAFNGTTEYVIEHFK
jgi:hypothetical protein